MSSRLILGVLFALALSLVSPGPAQASFETGQKAYRGGNAVGAAREWEKAAAAGDARAQYEFAMLLLQGDGITRDIAAAGKWFRSAAEAGHSEAQAQLGRLLALRKDAPNWSEAVAWWKKAEANGSPLAHYYLGYALLHGKGVKRDVEAGLTHLRIAAGYGNARAQNRLGAHYSKGDVVPLDPGIAVAFWKSAVTSGNRAAEYNLGNAYRQGRGAPQDFSKARALLGKAAAKGHTQAAYLIGLMHKNGEGGRKDSEEALKWFERAAEKGLKQAQFEMGSAYQMGHGVPADYAVAKHWYELAAVQGDKRASKLLSTIRELEETAARMRSREIEKARQRNAERRRATKQRDERLPAPGPSITYKGKTLVGSTYPDAQNEDFFSTVRKAIELSRELPKDLQNYVRLIDTIIYDPPSGHRKKAGVQTDIVGVYTIVDKMKLGPVVVYKDMRYSSPLQVSMSLLGNGVLAARHKRLIHLARKLADHESGRKTYPASEIEKSIGEMRDLVAAVNKTDQDLMNKAECEVQLILLKADKAYAIDQQKISARMQLLNQRKCW